MSVFGNCDILNLDFPAASTSVINGEECCEPNLLSSGMPQVYFTLLFLFALLSLHTETKRIKAIIKTKFTCPQRPY